MANAIDSLICGDYTCVFTLPYGSCSTAAATAAKAVTVSNFSLETGAQIRVKFTYANSASSPTLKVNSTDAKSIYWQGSALTSSQYWKAGAVVDFVYNGTQWDIVGVVKDNNTTYSVATTSANGLMSSSDKTELSNLTTIIKVNTSKLSMAQGYYASATGTYSHAEGGHLIDGYTTASGYSSHAEGAATTASGDYSHSEGYKTIASGDKSHAEGDTAIAYGIGSHAEGGHTTAGNLDDDDAGNYAHAEGYYTTASGGYAHAEGGHTTASGNVSHAEGMSTTASGSYAHAEGYNTVASGTSAHASGYGTIAKNYQYVVGKYNKDTTAPTSISDTTASAGIFIVGVGTASSARSNGFRINPAGKPYALSTLTSSGADYAEYFEWIDGNPTNEDRRGRFVTLDGDKIRYATAEDDYILGVVSAEPTVVGDSQSEAWRNMYLKDIYGERVVEVAEVEESVDENGNAIPAHTERRWVLNPDYDPEIKYISREERPEWDAIGIVGKLVAVDDGTCQVNGYCYPNTDGVATMSQSKTAYRVIERLDNTHIRIFIK